MNRLDWWLFICLAIVIWLAREFLHFIEPVSFFLYLGGIVFFFEKGAFGWTMNRILFLVGYISAKRRVIGHSLQCRFFWLWEPEIKISWDIGILLLSWVILFYLFFNAVHLFVILPLSISNFNVPLVWICLGKWIIVFQILG